MAQEYLWTVKQVADYLQLQESTIYSWAQDNKIPAFKIGRTWRFSRAKVTDWLGQHLGDRDAAKGANLAEEELMNVRQVAEYLQLQESTVYSWAQDGKVPALRIGRNWRFSRRLLADWVAQHLQATETDEEARVADEELMNVKQVADYLQLKESTVYSWAQDGKIPAIKIGRTWRFALSVLNVWLEQHAQEADSALGDDA